MAFPSPELRGGTVPKLPRLGASPTARGQGMSPEGCGMKASCQEPCQAVGTVLCPAAPRHQGAHPCADVQWQGPCRAESPHLGSTRNLREEPGSFQVPCQQGSRQEGAGRWGTEPGTWSWGGAGALSGSGQAVGAVSRANAVRGVLLSLIQAVRCHSHE